MSGDPLPVAWGTRPALAYWTAADSQARSGAAVGVGCWARLTTRLLRDQAPRCALVRDACRVTSREAFVVDDDGLAREEQTRSCRLILGVLADDAVRFQTDIPNGRSNDKPRA